MCKPTSGKQNQAHGTRTSAELHVLACPLHVANFFERVDDLVLQRKIEESLAVDATDSGTSSYNLPATYSGRVELDRNFFST